MTEELRVGVIQCALGDREANVERVLGHVREADRPILLERRNQKVCEQVFSGLLDGAVEVRVFPLQKSKADSVAAALAKGLSAGVRPGQPAPVVTAEAASNTVIVAATSEQMRQAAELIQPMDVSIEPDLPGAVHVDGEVEHQLFPPRRRARG